jgi:hypothetical protein
MQTLLSRIRHYNLNRFSEVRSEFAATFTEVGLHTGAQTIGIIIFIFFAITRLRSFFRQEKEVPIIDELIDKIKARLIDGKILPKSKLKEAMGYFCGLIPYLKNYRKDAFARLDNNVAKRAVRPSQ